jgi:hypothetical protein
MTPQMHDGDNQVGGCREQKNEMKRRIDPPMVL